MRTSVFLFLPFFAACQDAGVTKFNANPTVVITSHGDGDTVQEGEPELLMGQVGDADDGATALSVTWTVGSAEVCPDSAPEADGAVSCEATFGEAGGSVILAVSDPAGAGASATVDLDIQLTDAPVAEITAPTADGQYYADETIIFEGTVSDNEDAASDLTVTIETEALGDLGMDVAVNSEGEVSAFGLLPEGEHAVLLRVVDTSGKEGSDNVVINVGPENSVPTCAITAPEDGATGPAGEEVRFEGQVDDVDVPASVLSVSWESDKDGPLGESTPDSDGSVGVATSDLSINTHRITLTVTDDLEAPCTTSIYYTVSNTAPEVEFVAVTPDSGRVGDTLICTASATDPDGDALTISYAWDDGTSGDTYTINETNNPGDVLTCTATATDTDGATGSGSATATVENTNPVIDSIAVTPEEGPTGTTVTCTATASDPDGDSPTITYAWSDGSTGDTLTFPDDAIAGDPFTCTATATDEDGGTATDSATATVTNNAPVVDSVSISPDPAYNDDTLVCSATVTDPDGDTPTIEYTWTGGAVGPELPLTSIIAASGDTLTCTATATDTGGAEAVGTASITLGNRAPTIAVSIEPEEPSKHDTLVCTATEMSDPDDDAITSSWAWTVAEISVDATSSTDDATTLEGEFEAGQLVSCTGTVSDGKGGTHSATTTVTIFNTAPVVSDVTLSPSEVYTNDTITASADITDTDGDTLTVIYRFFVGFDMVQESSSNTLDGTIHFNKGDTVYVDVMADDGLVTHTDSSSTITVLNTPPTSPVLEIASDDEYCPEGWTLLDDENRCVAVFENTEFTWMEAEDDCRAKGGHLARVSSESDNATIYDLAADIPDESVWIGYNERDEEGTWVWSDGGPTDFSRWRVDEPGGGSPSTDEDCVALLHNHASGIYAGDWVDEDCETAGWVGGYACQVPSGKNIYSLEFCEDRGAHLRVADHDLPIGNAPRSFSVWFKTNGSWSNGNIFSYGIAAHDTNRQRFSMFVNWAGSSFSNSIHIAGQGYDFFLGDIGYTENEWQHAVVTYDGSTLKLFVQGELRGEETGLNFDTAPDTDFNIGTNTTDREDEWYQGFIADLRAWNRALSGPEVAALFDGGDVEPGLMAHWDFGEGAGTIIEEIRGTGWDAESITRGECCYPEFSSDIPDVLEADEPPLQCIIVEEAIDADGDPITYSFDWDVDGEEYTDTESLVYEGDAVPDDALGGDEVWTCEVTANDGEDWGEPGEASITLEETADWVSPSTGMRMALIPGGTFDMGCTDEMDVDGHCNWYESPVHTVTISNDFLVGITEVTQGQWEAVMGSNPSSAFDCGADCPVETISWNEAVEFANALSLLDGLEPVYSIGPEVGWDRNATGYRLLTEAEWEFAARADDGTTYAGSNVVSEVAWMNDTAGSTQPVAGLMPNGNGLYDMSGNVFELCWDWHSTDYYAESPAFDPIGPDGPLVDHVSRGGAYAYGIEHARISDRNRRDTPISRWNFTGLRLARTVESTYAWTHVGTEEVDMIYGSCTSIEDTSAICDASTVGEPIYINPTGADNLERKTLGETHMDLTGGRGSSISISADRTEATWQGATGCGGDYVQTDTVDIYRCVAE